MRTPIINLTEPARYPIFHGSIQSVGLLSATSVVFIVPPALVIYNIVTLKFAGTHTQITIPHVSP
ncbi:MAG TPA: hypothetical protein VFG46_00290 [Chryseolinea sp.]|nr:hypothetical protein [Chryseolinea sp.]